VRANPLLREPLKAEHIKNRLLGHWGSDPGQTFTWVHLNRLIKKYDLDLIYVSGPGHGAPATLANSYLEGVYSEVYPEMSEDVEGMQKFLKQFSFPGGIGSHCTPETPGSIHEGGELGYAGPQLIGDLAQMQKDFSDSSRVQLDVISDVEAGHREGVEHLLAAMGHIQFQDVMRQRMEHVQQALVEMRNHLLAGEFRDCDHCRCPRRGIARLPGEARPEVRRGVFRGHHKQVVKGGHGAWQGCRRQALIQTVKQLRPTCAQWFCQQAAARVRRQGLAPRAEVAVRTIAEPEAHFGMRGGQAEKDLAGIQSHPGKRLPNAIGGVQRDTQLIPYSFILR